MLRHESKLEDFTFFALDGEIGHVKDIYFDDEYWHVRYFIVRTGSWLNGRKVLISPDAVTPRFGARILSSRLTKEQVRTSPDIDTDRPVSRQQQRELHGYYFWPFYWTSTDVGTGLLPVAQAAVLRSLQRSEASPPAADQSATRVGNDLHHEDKGDPHLRSAKTVRGYHIAAVDGSLGHVEDFLVEDDTWSIRYLLVDTQNWLPSRKVIVPLSRVATIDWKMERLHLDLTREAIKSGPALDGSDPVSSDFSDRLEAHYDRSSPV